jgi:hypothetical protein
MATGNAMAKPAISIAATSKRLAKLNIAPPTIAETIFEASAERTLFRKLLGSFDVLPIVSARIREIRNMPTA